MGCSGATLLRMLSFAVSTTATSCRCYFDRPYSRNIVLLLLFTTCILAAYSLRRCISFGVVTQPCRSILATYSSRRCLELFLATFAGILAAYSLRRYGVSVLSPNLSLVSSQRTRSDDSWIPVLSPDDFDCILAAYSLRRYEVRCCHPTFYQYPRDVLVPTMHGLRP